MCDLVLVLNAGSSSLKFSAYSHLKGEDWRLELKGQIEGVGAGPRMQSWSAAMDTVSARLKTLPDARRVAAVGHRVVHGGSRYEKPTVVTPQVLAELHDLTPLAPLHQPHNLAPIRRLLDRAPDLPQVACFDTSFHSTNPDLAQRFALPEKLHVAGVRRYGFHGLSYEYIASVLADLDANAASGRTVVLHLGSGASMCAIKAGRSIASTMGFTALDGLHMGTRSGALDPGVILHLMNQCGMDARAIEKLLYNQSGLLGVSGISSDMRTLLASSDQKAKLAIDLYCYRIRRELGSLAAALGGLDAIVFTGGIGENSAVIRERVCRDAAWLGVEFNPAASAAGGPRISAPASRVSAWAIPTNEELMIARHTRQLIN